MVERRLNLRVKQTGAVKAQAEMSKLGTATKSAVEKFALFAGSAVTLGLVVRGIKDMVVNAGRIEGVSKAFEHTGESLYELREAVDGTVSDFTLMQNTVKATQLGITDMAQKLEFAKLRARQTGEEVQYLTEQLVLGLGRQSVMRLDDLGLSLRQIRQYMKETGDFSAAVNKVISEELAKAGKELYTWDTEP